MDRRQILLGLIVAFLLFGIGVLFLNPRIVAPASSSFFEFEEEEIRLEKPAITVVVPPYLSYDGVTQQLQTWNKEAPWLTEMGVCGKSSHGRDIYYLRVTNKTKMFSKPKVLITAAIHGNEKISTGCVMGMIGNLLNDYAAKPEVTELLDTRDIYFVPIISSDGYVNDSRHVQGVDPNRNFPSPINPNAHSVPCIQVIRKFFLEHKFNAAISGHAYGRIHMYPYGYTGKDTEHHAATMEILEKMSKSSGYGNRRIYQNTAPPNHGYEADWYYDNGSIAVVMEFGQSFHQSDIEGEVKRTYDSVRIFIKEAPLVRYNIKEKNWLPEYNCILPSLSCVLFQPI